MILYLLIIFFTVVILSLFNIFFGLDILQCQWWVIPIACLVGVVYEIAVDGLFAIIINKLPNKWFGPDKKCFEVSKRERKFLEKIKVKSWKEKICELGFLGGFPKNEIKEPNNPEYIERFLIEINKGIVTHWIGVFVGFTLILCYPLRFALPICLPIAIVNVFLNILPIMALRYNYPKLMVIRKKLLRDSERKNNSI